MTESPFVYRRSPRNPTTFAGEAHASVFVWGGCWGPTTFPGEAHVRLYGVLGSRPSTSVRSWTHRQHP
eukprot:3556112-Prymnesium_polylepis.1